MTPDAGSMNYLAHAIPFLDDPYFAAGTGVPDWLTVVDRQVRIRPKHVQPFVHDADPRIASIARGVLQHVHDDVRFHQTRAFTELSLELTASVRDVLGGESNFRPNFLGHLLVELLLDASLVADDPTRLEGYYRAIESVDGRMVEAAVNRMAPRRTARLAGMISRFCRERILWDYLEDAKLSIRLDQVMQRLKFDRLPERFRSVLLEARPKVALRKGELLEGIPVRPARQLRQRHSTSNTNLRTRKAEIGKLDDHGPAPKRAAES